MKVSSLSTLASLLLGVIAAPATSPEVVESLEGARSSKQQVNDLANEILSGQLAALAAYNKDLGKRGIKPSCTLKNLVFRKEYGSLKRSEKLEYIRAVQCLKKKPARTPKSVAPGARSRFDDFVVVHMQQTLSIHFTCNFQPWHRLFTWLYEKALREECGYTGYQPYWEWSLYDDPEDSPIFDGSETSLGGNGEYVPHNGTRIVPPPPLPVIQFPPGNGGGCVTKGPFSNEVVRLGPLGIDGLPPGPQNGFGDNPRCFKRDLGPWYTKNMAQWSEILKLLKTRNIEEHRNVSEGELYTERLGLHGAGHFSIGGDPGGDFYTSPGDPAFYLHHGQMDRLHTLWQGIDPRRRTFAITGTITFGNSPPSRNCTLDDVVEMGYAGPSYTIRELMSTTAGPFCYLYR